MSSLSKRLAAGALVGAGMSLIAGGLLAVPANAATTWTPQPETYGLNDLATVKNSAGQDVPRSRVSGFNIRAGATGTLITGADFTVTAPAGVTFFEHYNAGYTAGHTFPDVRKSDAAHTNYNLCTIVNPQQITCAFAGSGTSSPFLTGPANLWVTVPFTVAADAGGTLDITVEGTVNTSTGVDPLPKQTGITINAPTSWTPEVREHTPADLTTRKDVSGQDVERANVSGFRIRAANDGVLITGADLTLTAPQGVTFYESGSAYGAAHPYPDIRRANAASTNFDICTIVNPTTITCTFTGDGTSAPFTTGDGRDLWVTVPFSVATDASGTFDITVQGTITTPAGTETVPLQTGITIDAGQIVDTPVIHPAVAGLSLLATGGIGGVAALRRRGAARASA